MILILFRQIMIIFLLMGVGIILIKRNFLSQQGAKDLGAILINLVIPCVILKSYMIDFSTERLNGLIISAFLSLASLLIGMAVSKIFFGNKKRIENFAASFGNAGFIGIPLTMSVFGQEAVFYVAAYVAFLNLFQWTYGVYVMTGDKSKVSFKNVLKNPVFVSIIIGVVLFVLPISYPLTLTKTVGYIADLNTPLAMIVLGSYLVKLNFKDIFLSDRKSVV